MFDFKISLSSFRLCRRKTKSSAITHFYSPVNPKAREIAYPVIPSPPPTTPIHCLHQYRTRRVGSAEDEIKTNLISISGDGDGDGDRDRETAFDKNSPNSIILKKGKNSMDFLDESGRFSNDEPDSIDFTSKKGFMLSLSNDGAYRQMMKETLTVVQWSDHPYDDFKTSMLEMILEKEMFESKDLEQLLQCFLTLNHRNHHADIVAAFTEIWELLFR